MRANASLGELRRDKEKLSSPISCELRRDKASQGELRENGQPNVEVIRVNTYVTLHMISGTKVITRSQHAYT